MTTKPSKNPDVLTLTEVAAYLGVSDWWIKQRLKDEVRPIPSRKIAGLRRFLKSEVDAWFRSLPLDTGATVEPTPVTFSSRPRKHFAS